MLTGRSELDASRQAQLEELRKLGADVAYIRADIADHEQTKRLIAESKHRFGRINGIIHAAGVLRDSLIRNKTAQEMQSVFAPKLHGTLNLDEVTSEEELDFFAMFSYAF